MNVMKWVFEMCLCVREFLTAAAVKTDGQNGGANCTERATTTIWSLFESISLHSEDWSIDSDS